MRRPGPRGAVALLARRVPVAVAALLAASVIAFTIARALPTGPVEAALQARGLPATPENVAGLRRVWGLDAPVVEQYRAWLGGLLRGDWGRTTTTGVPIGPELWARAPLSLAIGAGGLAGGWVLAYAVGTAAAVGRRSAVVASRVLAVGAQSVPVFLVGVVVINLVGVQWRLVSFYRLAPPALVITPALLLAVFTAGGLVRVVHEHARALTAEPFFRAELARGLPRERILWSHGRRQVLHGLLAASVAEVATVTGAAAVLEFTFAVPGVNLYMIEGIRVRDYAVIQAYVMAAAVWVAAVHLVLGATLARLDPRTAT